MMDFTGMPFPTTMPMLPGWLIKLLKAMFTHPKKKETPQDVAERQRWRREFTDYVQKQAEATEQQVAAQLRAYAEQLLTLSQNELARYHISAVPFVHQVELLSMQIPGTIASEVSRRMTDSDAVYQKLCRMMPGAEKEKATQEFMREIIGQGVEKCSRLAQRVLDQLDCGVAGKAGAVAAAARAHAAGIVRACRSGRGRAAAGKAQGTGRAALCGVRFDGRTV